MAKDENLTNAAVPAAAEDGSLTDTINELRVMLTGSQLLTAFLMTLPFQAGFSKISDAEKWIYVVVFGCAILSMILFSAPAAQHRVQGLLPDRVAFKHKATRLAIIGLVPLSIALVLATQLVVSQVVGGVAGGVIAGLAAVAIANFWWTRPLLRRRHHKA